MLKLQDRKLTIWLFGFVSRTLSEVGGVFALCKDAVGVWLIARHDDDNDSRLSCGLFAKLRIQIFLPNDMSNKCSWLIKPIFRSDHSSTRHCKPYISDCKRSSQIARIKKQLRSRVWRFKTKMFGLSGRVWIYFVRFFFLIPGTGY